jgi:hypothetical protein
MHSRGISVRFTPPFYMQFNFSHSFFEFSDHIYLLCTALYRTNAFIRTAPIIIPVDKFQNSFVPHFRKHDYNLIWLVRSVNDWIVVINYCVWFFNYASLCLDFLASVLAHEQYLC